MNNPSSHPTAKILVCYHKPAPLIKNDIFVPIHVGRKQKGFSKEGYKKSAETEWLYENMIGDDTGDNVSEEGLKYSELTAIYWAWKNMDKLDNPDYVGLAHYRRLLLLHPENESDPKATIGVNYFSDEVIQKYTSPDYVLKDIENYDIYLFVQRSNSKRYETEGDQRRRVRGYQVEQSLQYMKERYPEEYADAEEYLARPVGNRCNMILCRRELFMECCDFMFDVLDGIDHKLDYSRYCAYDMRAKGFISEWLMGIWAFSKAKRAGYKVKEVPIVISRDSLPYNLQDSIQPAFEERNIPIFCACDEGYAYPCSIMLQSVIEHASPAYNYDIVVLNNGLSAESMEMLRVCLPPPQLTSRFAFTA